MIVEGKHEPLLDRWSRNRRRPVWVNVYAGSRGYARLTGLPCRRREDCIVGGAGLLYRVKITPKEGRT